MIPHNNIHGDTWQANQLSKSMIRNFSSLKIRDCLLKHTTIKVERNRYEPQECQGTLTDNGNTVG